MLRRVDFATDRSACAAAVRDIQYAGLSRQSLLHGNKLKSTEFARMIDSPRLIYVINGQRRYDKSESNTMKGTEDADITFLTQGSVRQKQSAVRTNFLEAVTPAALIGL